MGMNSQVPHVTPLGKCSMCKFSVDNICKNIGTPFIAMLNLKNTFNHSSVKINNQNIFFGMSLKKMTVIVHEGVKLCRLEENLSTHLLHVRVQVISK